MRRLRLLIQLRDEQQKFTFSWAYYQKQVEDLQREVEGTTFFGAK